VFGSEKWNSYRHVKTVYLNRTNPPLTNNPNRWLGKWFNSTHAFQTEIANTDYDSKLERAEKDWQFRTLHNTEGLHVPTWPPCHTYMVTYDLCHSHQHNYEARTANKQAPEKMTRHVTQCIHQLVTAIIWEGVLCNLFHSTGRVSLPKHLHH